MLFFLLMFREKTAGVNSKVFGFCAGAKAEKITLNEKYHSVLFIVSGKVTTEAIATVSAKKENKLREAVTGSKVTGSIDVKRINSYKSELTDRDIS